MPVATEPKVHVTVVPIDPEEPISELTLDPQDVPPNTPPNVIGLGKLLGGHKHGVGRRLTPNPGEWRMTLQEFQYEKGAVLVQRIEVKR